MKIRQHATIIALLAAAAPLVAVGSERFLGLVPCAFCLWQRWPYWVAVVLAALAAGLRARALLALAGVAILVSAGLGGLHVGVEQGWWPSPLPACSAPSALGAGSVEELMRGLSARPAKPCDAPTYLIPGLPISMAAMNMVYALVLGWLALTWAQRRANG
jgi:disulfide bond formation protein DsbB